MQYDEVVYDEKGQFEDLAKLPGGTGTFRRVLLRHSNVRTGPFGRLLGPTQIELVQAVKFAESRKPRKIYDKRIWGDLGFIHLCFDVQDMDDIKEYCRSKGHAFTVDSADSFDMGEAAGRFSYIEDPDGALIEFVETDKIPMLKAIGWYLDLTKRDRHKPLPDWMLLLQKLKRVK